MRGIRELIMNIVVLAGGTSTERDISISTGINVAKSLKRDGHNVNLIDVFLGTDKYNSAEEFFNEDNDFDKLEEYLKSRTKEELRKVRLSLVRQCLIFVEHRISYLWAYMVLMVKMARYRELLIY